VAFDVVEFVREELLEFTGLPETVLDEYLQRSGRPGHPAEWTFWKPRCDEEIHWYYVTSRAYLFANATHRLLPKVAAAIEPGSRVLDFGGGSGNYSFHLARHGCEVYYFEISLLQREFVKRVAKRHRLPITVLEADGLDPPTLGRQVDAVLALDVLEHIPDYAKYVSWFAESLKPEGKLYVYAPFASGEPAHLTDRCDLRPLLAGLGFVGEGCEYTYLPGAAR
jgi:SAM-dependent methyltransferase